MDEAAATRAVPSAVKIKIVTPRLEATRRFYQDIFGLVAIEAWDEPDDAGCILALSDPPGTGLVEIYRGERVHDFSGLCLQFKVPDIHAFLRSVTPGLAARGPVSRPWGSTYLHLTDPAGVPIVVFAGQSW
jgi:catechol 2,3-dioxygenase-like lactoylglutathione lyase family enzyme